MCCVGEEGCVVWARRGVLCGRGEVCRVGEEGCVVWVRRGVLCG